MAVDLGGDAAWQILVASDPALENMDLVRFTLDIDGAMDQIVATVDSVFGNDKDRRSRHQLSSRLPLFRREADIRQS